MNAKARRAARPREQPAPGASRTTSSCCTTSRCSTSSTGKILGAGGAAALAPSRSCGLIPPGEFIPLAEVTGPHRAHRRLGAAHRLRPGARVAREGHPGAHGRGQPLARASSSRPTSSARSRSALAETGLAADALELEITESNAMQNAEAIDQHAARAEGAGRPHLDRRLRHRLLVAQLPQALPHRHASRSTSRSCATCPDRPGRRRHRHRRHRHGATASKLQRRRRRRGDRGAARVPQATATATSSRASSSRARCRPRLSKPSCGKAGRRPKGRTEAETLRVPGGTDIG